MILSWVMHLLVKQWSSPSLYYWHLQCLANNKQGFNICDQFHVMEGIVDVLQTHSLLERETVERGSDLW